MPNHVRNIIVIEAEKEKITEEDSKEKNSLEQIKECSDRTEKVCKESVKEIGLSANDIAQFLKNL